MRTIYKYDIPIEDSFTVQMPHRAQILCVQAQHARPCIWAIVDTDMPTRPHRFQLRGTGRPCESFAIAASTHIGTFQLRGGDLVFHLFVDDSPEN